MNKVLEVLVTMIFLVYHVSAQELDTIYAVSIDSNDFRFEKSIGSYQKSENWQIWSLAETNILDLRSIRQNINDKDLTTAWVEEEHSGDSSSRIEFAFNFHNSFFGAAIEFFGQINVFNGWCKSEETWKNHGRIKTLRVCYNEMPFCYVELLDTWHFQYFSLAPFFKNRYLQQNLAAPHECVTGDHFTFEVIETYPGLETSKGCLSCFMIEGAKN